MLMHAVIAVLFSAHAAGLATGVKVGEIAPDSAFIWVRATASAERNTTGLHIAGQPAKPLDAGVRIEDLEGACPGAPGSVRVRYGTDQGLTSCETTEWIEVGAQTDYTHVFHLEGLTSATKYFYSAEVKGKDDAPQSLLGQFATAPTPDTHAPATFTVVTGMFYGHLDSPEGFHSYEAMRRLAPDFHVLTGDTVYYDNDAPVANSIDVARYHWHRMYSLPRLVQFHLAVPAYWEKDDHDTYHNDCWPGMVREKMGSFTFDQGKAVFLEQAPMGAGTSRSVRWGKDLEVWLVEGRDFRSPNDAPDGPAKSIWGDNQKRWLKESLLASNATWKVLVSPTPLVGPDRGNKADNHANATFAHEGSEMRKWFAENLGDRFFVICGDRHWQYYSIDPETRLREFSCGPASDEHAGGSPGEDPAYHQFHRVKGGFLSVSVLPKDEQSNLRFRFHDVHGGVVYEKAFAQ
ncbi:MAG: alkaline phosphatase D family protein [Candidatus Hydrogenedentes bacterium]|nr:alkaline phosphatase D family protein [Candidatus Hydrogenedentota bacterium]